MSKFNKFLLCLGVVMIGAVFSYKGLSRQSLSAFVLRGGKEPEAFKIQFLLCGGETTITALRLKGDQEKKAVEILRQKDTEGLAGLAKDWGRWDMSVGIPNPEDSWPWYFGGGWKSSEIQGKVLSFDNLGILDRWLLAFAVKGGAPAPFQNFEIALDLNKPVQPPPVGIPNAVAPPQSSAPKGGVRVEILNGCGITNAADWAARRLKGPGIVILNVENADHFHYPKTIVKTSIGVPVALEEGLERLGLTKEAVEETTPGSSSNLDVTLIVGKDYSTLKERFRERIHR